MNTITSIKVNQGIYTILKNRVKNNLSTSEVISNLIIGPYGSGKTTLLRKLCTSLTKENINVLWIDGRTIFNTKKIIEQIDSTDTKIICIDDINYLFDRTSVSEQIEFANYIKTIFPNRNLIGSMDKYHEALLNCKIPFFQFFHIIEIPPLELEPIWEILLTVEQKKRAHNLSSFLSPTISHAIEIYEIVKGRKGYDLLQLIERHGEYYTLMYNRLSHYAQNILNNLAENADGFTMSELRYKTYLPTNIISSYIKVLREKGIISYDLQTKGLTKYKICDPLFRKWLIAEPMKKF